MGSGAVTEGIADTVRVQSIDDGKSYTLTFDVKVEEERRVRVTWKAGENPTGRLTDGQRVQVAGKVTNGEITSPLGIYNQSTKSFVKRPPGIRSWAKIGLILPLLLLPVGLVLIFAARGKGYTEWVYLFFLAVFVVAHAAIIYRLFAKGFIEWFGCGERRIPDEVAWGAACSVVFFLLALLLKVKRPLEYDPVLLLVPSLLVLGIYVVLFLAKSDRPRKDKSLWVIVAASWLVVAVGLFFFIPAKGQSPVQWTTPTNLGPNVNTPMYDGEPGLTPGGDMLYFATNRGGNLDIWQSIRSGGEWQPASPTRQVNTSSYDGNPAFLQSVNLEMYLTSYRDSDRNSDIYQSIYQNGVWGRPIRLPESINTISREYGCALYRREGRPRMVLLTMRPGGEGDYDLWETEWDGNWLTPWHLAGLNSPARESAPAVSEDGRYLYFGSNRSGGYGKFDLYVSEWTGSEWGPPVNLGSEVNTAYDEYVPAITSDGQTLYFASNRPGGLGGMDIWVTEK